LLVEKFHEIHRLKLLKSITMKRVIKSLAIVLTLTVFGLFNTGCNHDKTCTAVIKVVAADGTTPVAGADVQLYATISTQAGPVTADLKAESTTDNSGQVTFKFQLPAILDIKATKGTLAGQGIIKLEEKATVNKTITIQ
jgi:hypothetical protein